MPDAHDQFRCVCLTHSSTGDARAAVAFVEPSVCCHGDKRRRTSNANTVHQGLTLSIAELDVTTPVGQHSFLCRLSICLLRPHHSRPPPSSPIMSVRVVARIRPLLKNELD